MCAHPHAPPHNATPLSTPSPPTGEVNVLRRTLVLVEALQPAPRVAYGRGRRRKGALLQLKAGQEAPACDCRDHALSGSAGQSEHVIGCVCDFECC